MVKIVINSKSSANMFSVSLTASGQITHRSIEGTKIKLWLLTALANHWRAGRTDWKYWGGLHICGYLDGFIESLINYKLIGSEKIRNDQLLTGRYHRSRSALSHPNAMAPNSDLVIDSVSDSIDARARNEWFNSFWLAFKASLQIQKRWYVQSR